VIDGDPVPELTRLKEEPGKDIVQYGFGQLSHTMLEHGLLGELRLWIHPFIIGKGGPDDLLPGHQDGALPARGHDGPRERHRRPDHLSNER